MPQMTRIRFGQMYLLVAVPDESTGATTGATEFVAPCGITSFGKSISTATSDVELVDCDDPDAPVWLGIDVVSKRMTLNISGTLDSDAYVDIWREWFMDEASRDIRVVENLGSGNQGYWEGAGVLTEYSDTAEGRGSYTMTATLVFDGRPTWVPQP